MSSMKSLVRCLLATLLIVGAFGDAWGLFKPRKTPQEQILGVLDEAAKEISFRTMRIGFNTPSLSDAIDLMAVILQEHTERNPEILDGLAEVIAIENFVASPLRRDVSLSGGPRYVMGRQSSLTDAFSRIGSNPNVATRLKDPEAKQFLRVESKLLRLPLGERLQFEEAMKEAYGEDVTETTLNVCPLTKRRKRSLDAIKSCMKKTIVCSARAAFYLCQRVAQVGIMVLDQVYMAPEMVFKLPVVGEKLQKLKSDGAPLYLLIKYIRSMHYLYKVKVAEPGTEIDNGKVREAEKMIGDIGLMALGSVASRLIKRYSGSENEKQEVISRTTMAFFVKLLDQGVNFVSKPQEL